jgi:hypothetical protein
MYKGQAVNRFGQFLPPLESKLPKNLSPFIGLLGTASGNGDKRLTK